MYLQAFLLSMIQSLTEFLPVSSSGHLILLHSILKDHSIINNISFDVALHFGSMLAIVVYFWKDILRLISSLFSKNRNNLVFYIIIGIIPAGFCGYFLDSFIESLRSVYVVLVSLIVGALIFIIVEKFSKTKKDLNNIDIKNSIFIGVMQCLSLIPGISRSGITVSAGMLSGLKRTDAAKFSFFMAIPLIFGAFIKETTDMVSIVNINLFVFGIICSFVLSLLSIFILMKLLEKYSLSIFAYYRIFLALIIFILIQLGKI
ncbi:MAG TPA: undecaprenyl-diphosphatase UppP [bacterium]|nr:undecaprenyl-diphosphatase UppP [bacterium]